MVNASNNSQSDQTRYFQSIQREEKQGVSGEGRKCRNIMRRG